LSLQDVERKLLASAEQEARQITDQAEAQATADFERRGAALRDEQQRSIAAAKAEADAAVERDLTTRRAEHTMSVLKAKNEILDAIFTQAGDRAVASQGFNCSRWLAQQVRRACAAGAGTLYCTDRDRAAVTALVREAGAKNITVGPEPGLMRAGVYLVSTTFDLDFTLDAILADLRDELTVTLTERLFADVPAIGTPPGG